LHKHIIRMELRTAALSVPLHEYFGIFRLFTITN
jgi:hypothetical protein